MAMFDRGTASPPVTPAPLGFWPTIGWLGAAVLAATLFGVALLKSYKLIFGALPADIHVGENLVLSTDVVLVVVLVEIVRSAGWSVKDYFALTVPTPPQVALAIATGATFIVIDNAVGAFAPDPPEPSDFLDYYKAVAEGVAHWFWLNLVFMAPVAEEMIFRGFPYRGWSQTPLGPRGAIVLTAIGFGLMHLQYDAFGIGSIMISGLLLGWLRQWSGSVVVPMLAHATSNAIIMFTLASIDW
jgi:membrane protease YdiL (CAAX protease family)